jgi:hypothetical protein
VKKLQVELARDAGEPACRVQQRLHVAAILKHLGVDPALLHVPDIDRLQAAKRIALSSAHPVIRHWLRPTNQQKEARTKVCS